MPTRRRFSECRIAAAIGISRTTLREYRARAVRITGTVRIELVDTAPEAQLFSLGRCAPTATSLGTSNYTYDEAR